MRLGKINNIVATNITYNIPDANKAPIPIPKDVPTIIFPIVANTRKSITTNI
jgi:hypothetical protein